MIMNRCNRIGGSNAFLRVFSRASMVAVLVLVSAGVGAAQVARGSEVVGIMFRGV